MKYVIYDHLLGMYRAEESGTLLTQDLSRAYRWTGKRAAEVAQKCYIAAVERYTKQSVEIVLVLS